MPGLIKLVKRQCNDCVWYLRQLEMTIKMPGITDA